MWSELNLLENTDQDLACYCSNHEDITYFMKQRIWQSFCWFSSDYRPMESLSVSLILLLELLSAI